MLKATLILFILSLLFSSTTCDSPGESQMKAIVETDLNTAVKQYSFMMQNIPADVMPRTFDASSFQEVTTDTKWWTSGFYPGTLWYLYEYSHDTMILHEAEKRLTLLEKEKYNIWNHDLGFMLFCSFGNAYRITGKPEYKDVLCTAASSLATRYRPTVKTIQSWEAGDKYHCPVIIDNMMNLELLYWAGENGGKKQFRDIAVTHANTTLINHFRPDNSTWHVVDYDPDTGIVLRKMTAQGASDSSSWSRGQSWGLYGYTMMYRFTHDDKYLKKATAIASFLLSHPNMPEDGISYWDYNAPGIPDTFRDASSAAIMASALLELTGYVNNSYASEYKRAAEKILITLSSKKYFAAPNTNGGFILLHSVGSLPDKSEVDVPLTYADYYFIEALLRYKKKYLD